MLLPGMKTRRKPVYTNRKFNSGITRARSSKASVLDIPEEEKRMKAQKSRMKAQKKKKRSRLPALSMRYEVNQLRVKSYLVIRIILVTVWRCVGCA